MLHSVHHRRTEVSAVLGFDRLDHLLQVRDPLLLGASALGSDLHGGKFCDPSAEEVAKDGQPMGVPRDVGAHANAP